MLKYGSREKTGLESGKKIRLIPPSEDSRKNKNDLFLELYLILDNLLSDAPSADSIDSVFPLLCQITEAQFAIHYERHQSADGKAALEAVGTYLPDKFSDLKDDLDLFKKESDSIFSTAIKRAESSKLLIFNSSELSGSNENIRFFESLLFIPVWINNEVSSAVTIGFEKKKELVVESNGIILQKIESILQNTYSLKYRLIKQELTNRLYLGNENSSDIMEFAKKLSSLLLDIEGIDISELYINDDKYHLMYSNLGTVKELYQWHFEGNKALVERTVTGRRIYFNQIDLEESLKLSTKREFCIRSGAYIPLAVNNRYSLLLFVGSIRCTSLNYKSFDLLESLTDKAERILKQKIFENHEDEDFNRYVIAADIGKLGIWELDLINNKFHSSNSIRRLIGSYDFDMGMEISDLLERIHPSDRKKVYNCFRVSIRKRILTLKLDFRIIDTDHETHWVAVKGRLLLDNEMKISKIIGITQDITEDKNEFEREKADDNRLLDLLAAIPDKVYKFDLDANLIDYFVPFREGKESDPEDNIGKNVNEFFPGDLAQTIRQMIRKVKESGKTEVLEFQDSNKMNEFREARIIPAKNESFIAIVRNISEKKLLELKSENAVKEAELANKAKSEFIANMSHEFRTPLNGILGYAQILRNEEGISPNIQRGLDIIAKSGNLLLNIINDILDLSKIEANHFEIKEAEFGFIEFLEGISALVQLKAEEKNLNFYHDISQDLPDIVNSDEKVLSQILLNLLTNAVKFTRKGEVKLKVFRHSSKIRFEIVDTGEGIPKDSLEEIFKPFKQIDSTTNKSEGTGLGLTITRKLVMLMGSELKVETEVGKGSTFYFDLCVKEIYKNLGTNKNKTKKIVGYRGDKKSILVIDDIVENRSFIKTILTRIGFVVYEAAGANEGIEKAVEYRPDVIFMDLVMPKMSGIEAMKIIKEKSPDSTMKIIAFTANVMQNIKEECFEAGCCDFIAKPVTIKDLTNSLKDHLGLEWIYETHSEANYHKEIGGELSHPPAKDAVMLYDAMLTGDLNTIGRELEKLKQNEKYDKFIHLVDSLANSFHINKLRDLAKKYIDRQNA
jgi:signal transduction histidine kinase/DNA-binding NarL/FixJ family response regulator